MKVLFVKLSSLGDVTQTIPVVADLKAAFPDVVIDWVVEEAFAPLVERVDGVRRVIPMAGRRWRKTRWSTQTRFERKAFLASLQSESYDSVIDFQGLIKSALVARQARLTPGGTLAFNVLTTPDAPLTDAIASSARGSFGPLNAQRASPARRLENTLLRSGPLPQEACVDRVRSTLDLPDLEVERRPLEAHRPLTDADAPVDRLAGL